MAIIQKFIQFPIRETDDPCNTGFKFCGEDEETIIIYGEGFWENTRIAISPPYKCPSEYVLRKGDFSKSYSVSFEIFNNGHWRSLTLKSNLTKQEALREVPCGFTERCIWFYLVGNESSECGNVWCNTCTGFEKKVNENE